MQSFQRLDLITMTTKQKEPYFLEALLDLINVLLRYSVSFILAQY